MEIDTARGSTVDVLLYRSRSRYDERGRDVSGSERASWGTDGLRRADAPPYTPAVQAHEPDARLLMGTLLATAMG